MSASLPSQDAAHRLTDRILAMSGADATEVALEGADLHLTRFARNEIHQNVASRDLQIRVRAVIGRRVGVAATNDPSDEAIRRVVSRACEIARHQPEATSFPGLPPASTAASEPARQAFVARTAAFTPTDRAEQVGVVCRRAAEAGLSASGAFETGQHSLTVANSHGLFGHHAGTRASLSAVVMDDESSGYASRLTMDVAHIDAGAVAREAIDKALRGRGPTEVRPGDWTVILEPYAVADLVAYLGYVGFGALGYLQGASFHSGRFGQQVCSDEIDIWDDGLDPAGILSPFDYEGVARQRVSLIDRGLASGVVWDTETAARDGRRSTGHALPAPNPFGPFPCNLMMRPGVLTPPRLLEGIQRGLWITRFHYVNVMVPKTTTITGMTRDGTFLIEGGRLSGPVKNLRFTERILGALDRVTGVGGDSVLLPAWFGAVRCPALRIEGFRFSDARNGQ